MPIIFADCIELIKSDEGPAVTGMKTCEFTYDWTIKNFGGWNGDTFESPIFSSHYADFNDNWSLKFYPRDIYGAAWFAVELQLRSYNNTSQLQTKCELNIDNWNVKTMEYSFCKFGEKIILDQYVSLNDLECTIDRHTMNHGTYMASSRRDVIRIRCTIRMSQKGINCPSADEISKFNAKQQLSQDWKKLLLNEKSSDVTIQVGQKSFRAIKAVLEVRSPVFAAMFDNKKFKKNKKKKVVIDDIKEDVFEEFLHYIYTGESPKVDKIPMELLAVAEKYQMDCLKNICEEAFCKTIDNDNVASLLVCSDTHNLKQLNQQCLEFKKKKSTSASSPRYFY